VHNIRRPGHQRHERERHHAGDPVLRPRVTVNGGRHQRRATARPRASGAP
jgi:hypothetical protein